MFSTVNKEKFACIQKVKEINVFFRKLYSKFLKTLNFQGFEALKFYPFCLSIKTLLLCFEKTWYVNILTLQFYVLKHIGERD